MTYHFNTDRFTTRSNNMSRPLNEPLALAYALGYYHGRTMGTEDMPEHYENDKRAAYIWGYDAGVYAYCQEIEGATA